MALTTDDLQTSLAYRLGETSAPADSTTKALRLEWINQAYLTIARRKLWWWLEATSTSNTNPVLFINVYDLVLPGITPRIIYIDGRLAMRISIFYYIYI